MRSCAAAAGLIVLAVSSSGAQTTLPVEEGERVRVYRTADGSPSLTGRLLKVMPDSIRLAIPERPSGVWIDTASIRALEIRVAHESRRKQTLIGGLVGAAAGLGLALAFDGHEQACPTDLAVADCRYHATPAVYAITIGTGTGLGALIGHLLAGSRWQAVWWRE